MLCDFFVTALTYEQLLSFFYDESPLCASAYLNYNQAKIISGKKDMMTLHYTATNKVQDP